MSIINHSKVIILTGLPMAGKTTTGIALAKLLGYSFIDLDQYISQTYNLTIPEIFEQHGEKLFREYEHNCLVNLLNQQTNNLILSLGGGTVCFYNNLDLCLKNGILFWLNTSLDLLEKNLNNNNLLNRPIFSNQNPKDVLQKLYSERKEYYKHAKYTININQEINPYQIANNIINIMNISNTNMAII
ncbi:shikimate kinase [Rickettsiales bacterium LUAb2]